MLGFPWRHTTIIPWIRAGFSISFPMKPSSHWGTMTIEIPMAGEMHPAMTSGPACPAMKLQEAWTYHGMAIFFSATRQQTQQEFSRDLRSPGLGQCRNTHGRKAR